MNSNRFFAFVVGLSLLAQGVVASDSPSFRGPARDGIFPEKGLLRSWPAEGPKELWFFEGLGEGYASLSVMDGVLYTTGKTGEQGFVYAITEAGKLKWKVPYGTELDGGGFPGARSTPELDATALYITTGPGKVIAYERESGKMLWEADMVGGFGGTNPRFNFSESLLLDGDNLICTPGGPDASVVALNKKTGAVVWKTAGLSDKASYCSARIFDNGKVRQIITLTEALMVGIDPKTGKVLWRTDYPVTYGIHATSPVFSGNTLYISDGYGQGGRAYELAADGNSVKELWKEATIDVHHGGAVLLDGHVYGASSKGVWGCIELATGKVVSSFGPRGETFTLGKGAAVSADGLLYGYDEKGNVGLIDPNPKAFKPISVFTIKRGEAQHWGHPVINKGRLYIRHGNVLMCFDIKA